MYYGGKNGSGVYQKIINWIPPHTKYIELFLGSGAIIRQKKPALSNIGIEIDQKVISQFFPECNPMSESLQYIFTDGTFTIRNESAFDFLQWYKRDHLFSKDTFIYADPPYPLGSRRSSKEVYDYELTDQQHRTLLQLLLSIPDRVAISTYKNPIYEKMLRKWNCITFPSQTRVGTATEYLYMNYPAPAQLHDYSFLGEDFIERQRIKRKIERHVSRLEQLPDLERAAILEALQVLHSQK